MPVSFESLKDDVQLFLLRWGKQWFHLANTPGNYCFDFWLMLRAKLPQIPLNLAHNFIDLDLLNVREIEFANELFHDELSDAGLPFGEKVPNGVSVIDCRPQCTGQNTGDE